MTQSAAMVKLDKKSLDLSFFLKLFFIMGVSGFGVYLILAIVLACLGGDKIHILTATIPFSDFAETLSYAICPNPYTGEYNGIACIYPPLSFLVFLPFTWICRKPLEAYFAGTLSLQQLSSNGWFIVSFVLYYIINLAIIMYIAARFTKLKGMNLCYLLVTLFCFGPLLFEFVRANNTLSVCILALGFFYLNSSEKRWKRELSYLCFAGAVAFKIYPVFIIFYLVWKEKGLEKLWSVLKTLGYIVVLVFLPFVFIDGGFSNIPVLLGNVLGFSNPQSLNALALELPEVSVTGPTTWGTNISITTVVFYILMFFTVLFGGGDIVVPYNIIGSILRYSLVIIAVVLPFLSFKSKKQKEFVLLSVGTYLMFPGVCNGYCMTLMIIPFLYMLKEWETMSYRDKVLYTVCYAIIFNPILYTYGFFFTASVATLVLMVKGIVDIIKEDVGIFKAAKANKTADGESATTATTESETTAVDDAATEANA